MPAFNEAPMIGRALEEVRTCIFNHVLSSELVVVDDGSTDATATIVRQAAKTDSRIRIVPGQNAGHGPALLAGISVAHGEYLLLLDSDCQIDLSAFKSAWRLIPNCDAVIGVRAYRQDPFYRLIISWLMRAYIYVLFGTAARDSNVPFKLLRHSVWKCAQPGIEKHTLIPSTLLSIYLTRHAQVAQITVGHRPRRSSHLRGFLLMRFCVAAAIDLARYRWLQCFRTQARKAIKINC
jgi:glycosyltransferase involved in cell wall biosynthesis